MSSTTIVVRHTIHILLHKETKNVNAIIIMWILSKETKNVNAMLLILNQKYKCNNVDS